jgi:hypothetical protein
MPLPHSQPPSTDGRMDRVVSALLGARGSRPYEERAILGFLLPMAGVALVGAPINLLLGIDGGVVVANIAAGIQMAVSWALFRYVWIDRDGMTLSLCVLAGWVVPFFFLAFDGSLGIAPLFSAALAAPALFLVRGGRRALVVAFHSALIIGLIALENLAPNWVQTAYLDIAQQRSDIQVTWLISAVLVFVGLGMVAQQYAFRVGELEQAEAKLDLLLATRARETLRLPAPAATNEQSSGPPTLQAGQLLGAYTIRRVLGSGGLATVWLAIHNELGTLHAVKVVHASGPAVQQRLLREGRVQAELRHPNLVRVTGTVVVDKFVGLVMAYQRAGTLRDVLRRQQIALNEVDRLAQGILAGMAHAHAKGFVHRDLKPSNILLDPSPDGPRPRVADFGLVKAIHETDATPTLTETGQIMGTPAYMAPEQIEDPREVDQRADVFSLGCILYEMLIGERVFAETKEGPWVLMKAVLACKVPPLPDHLPPRMRNAVESALSKEPANRPDNAGALLALWLQKDAGP